MTIRLNVFNDHVHMYIIWRLIPFLFLLFYCLYIFAASDKQRTGADKIRPNTAF